MIEHAVKALQKQCFRAFEESFNRFPGFNYEVQGVYQEQVNGRICFHTYVVRE